MAFFIFIISFMAKTVVVLVDGQNLYYSLQEMSIIEKEVDWTVLFNSMIDAGEELIRAYWFRPAKILDTYYTETNIRNSIVYKKYRTHLENYKNGKFSAIPKTVQDSVNSECSSILEWIKKQKEKFANIEYAYDQLCLEHDNIEMVKTGVLKIN